MVNMKKSKLFAVTCTLAAVILAGSALPVMAADTSGAADDVPGISQQAPDSSTTPSDDKAAADAATDSTSDSTQQKVRKHRKDKTAADGTADSSTGSTSDGTQQKVRKHRKDKTAADSTADSTASTTAA